MTRTITLTTALFLTALGSAAMAQDVDGDGNNWIDTKNWDGPGRYVVNGESVPSGTIPEKITIYQPVTAEYGWVYINGVPTIVDPTGKDIKDISR